MVKFVNILAHRLIVSCLGISGFKYQEDRLIGRTFGRELQVGLVFHHLYLSLGLCQSNHFKNWF